ncbi:flagellar hook-associated protein 2 [Zobellella denitrificans]|uniref:flagellar filament capping protein FliD n=1 Tax=Zobellella denitrificans TaxID=347534 RepID=UPI000B8C4683|nr:flagellar filament capping protein FliD [Zobellella denitrificans]OXS14048.1 flagellar hook-associated protein 2 [Zobellella denitrificans]
MSGLKLPGVGSGFPIQSFVDAVVSAERTPKEQQLARRANSIDVQLSAYGGLKSVLDEFKTALKKLGDEEAFQKRSARFSESGFLTAKADKSAVAGSYSLVVEQLAEAHKIGSDYITGENAKSLQLGSGTLELTSNGESFSVDIARDKSSLADIAEAINNAEDNKGVRATVVTDDLGSRLVLFAEKTGVANEVSLSVSGNGDGDDHNGNPASLALLGNFDTLQAAQDARIKLDGATITSATNEFKDAVTGLTLTASKVSDWTDDSKTERKATTLTIGYDKTSVETNLKGFVESFNKVMSTIKQLTAYNVETQKAGPLNGDGSARAITAQIRALLSEAVEGAVSPVKSLTDLGITTKQDGTIELDAALLKKQVDENFEKVGLLFASEKGVAEKLDDLLEGFVGKEGMLTEKDKSLREQMKKLEKEADAFTLRMEEFEARTYKQFSAMDIAVARMNQQLNSVVSAFESMPDFNSWRKK